MYISILFVCPFVHVSVCLSTGLYLSQFLRICSASLHMVPIPKAPALNQESCTAPTGDCVVASGRGPNNTNGSTVVREKISPKL